LFSQCKVRNHFSTEGGYHLKIYWNFGIFIYIYIYLLLLLLLFIRLPRRFTPLKKIPKALFHFGILLEFFSHFGIFLFHPAKHRQPIVKKSHTRHLFEMSSCGILMSVGRAILEHPCIAFHGVVEFVLTLIKEKSYGQSKGMG
jgi:hypothetical protein